MTERRALPTKPRLTASASPPSPKGVATERKIYVLPIEQIERIKEYQRDYAIASEVEAVRRLLDLALEMRDTVSSLLKKLQSKYQSEKDLRLLAKDILASHSRVRSISFNEGQLQFSLAENETGMIDNRGRIFVGRGYDNWDEVAPPKPSTRGWEAPSKPTELDDDIPF